MASTTPTGRRAAKAEMTPPGARSVVSISCGGRGRTVGSIAPSGVAVEAVDHLGQLQAVGHLPGGPGLGLDEGRQLVVAGGDGVGQRVEQVGPLRRGRSATRAAKAACAASTAASASSTEASGASPTTASVAGLRIS